MLHSGIICALYICFAHTHVWMQLVTLHNAFVYTTYMYYFGCIHDFDQFSHFLFVLCV